MSLYSNPAYPEPSYKERAEGKIDVRTFDTLIQVLKLKDFAEEIITLTGTDQKIVYKPLPADDPMQRKPDISKAIEILNWNPKVDRSEGLKITFDYFKSLTRDDLYKKEHNTFEKYIR